MAASFDDQFEAWLTDRLRALKDRALRQFDCTSSPASRSTVAMSRLMSSPTGNYYKFVYDEDSDDDNGDNDDTLPPISPDEEPELLPEISPTDVEFGDRRQRLARLLGREAIVALDLADLEYNDLDQPEDNVHGPELDENLNRKVGGGTFMSRAQDYSTTSLEFSDLESLVSDSVGRQSEDEDVGWNRPEPPRGSAERLQLDAEPVSFVEFTAANDDDDADVEEHPRRKRRGGSKQPRYDHLVSVRYHREDFTDLDHHGDFIDDDTLLHRCPPGSDVIVTSRDAADVSGRQQLPMTSVLPLDVAEMAMDESCCEVHTDRDRDPIVRVDDPDYETRYSKSTPCCCRSTMTWQRRLFLVAGSVALLTAAALLAILVFLVVTRP